jgi:hypothetical protein
LGCAPRGVKHGPIPTDGHDEIHLGGKLIRRQTMRVAEPLRDVRLRWHENL